MPPSSPCDTLAGKAGGKTGNSVRYKCVPKSDNETVILTDSGSSRPRNSAGYKSSFVIIALYIVALLCAVGHYVFFHLLDGVPVDDISISQSYVSAGSIALTFVFKTCIVASLWSSFTQWLWRNLRKQETLVGTIEDLTRMPHDPMSLLNWKAFRVMPLLFVCALGTWMVGIAAIFPPGGLIVRSHDFQTTKLMDLPIFDPAFRGNGTVLDLQNNALFTLLDTGEYYTPKPSISRLAKKVILLQQPVSAETPCGQNCSYSVQMQGPSYQCDTGLSTGNMVLPDELIYYGNQTMQDGNFLFEANWTIYSNYTLGGLGSNLVYDSITCVAFSAIYEMAVSYMNGLQSVRSSITPQAPLPSTNLSDAALFDPQVNRTANGTLLTTVAGTPGVGLAATQSDLLEATADENPYGYIFTPHVQSLQFNDSKTLPGFMNVTTALKLSSTRALHDALARALGGGTTSLASTYTGPDVSVFKIYGDDNTSDSYGNSTNSSTTTQVFDQNSTSLILDSNMASFSRSDPTAVWLNITSSSLQDLLTNITISLLTIPNTSKSINVTSSTSRNVYAFARPINVILPYAVTLLLSLCFVGIGLVMLWKNGTPATTGGLLQVLCSTQGSPTLTELVMRTPGSASDDLKMLKVRYGNLGRVSGKATLGFGTRDEVEPLI